VRRIWHWLVSSETLLRVSVAVLVVVVVFSFVFAMFTTIETHQVVDQHNQDLAVIRQNTNEIKSLQQQHRKDLTTVQQEGQAIEQYAQDLEGQIKDSQGTTYSILVALCHSTPGCVVPS